MFWRSAARRDRVCDGNQGPKPSLRCDYKRGPDASLPASPAPDILVNNAGGRRRGFPKFEREDWIKALDGTFLPDLPIKATLDGMSAPEFRTPRHVTSHAGKTPVAMLSLSTGARPSPVGGLLLDLRARRRAKRDDQPLAAWHLATDG